MKIQILFNSNLENSKNPSVYKASLFNSNSETGYSTIFINLIFYLTRMQKILKNLAFTRLPYLTQIRKLVFQPFFKMHILFNSITENLKNLAFINLPYLTWIRKPDIEDLAS